MKHRAPRPLLDSWRGLSRATARRPVLSSLVIVLTLGIAGYAGVASLTGGPGSPQADSSAPAAAPGTSLPTEPSPESDSPEPLASHDESPAPSSGQPRAPSPTSDADPSLPAPLEEVTRSPGAEPERSFGSPSTPDPSTPDPSTADPSTPEPSTPAEDDTAPSTTLSADYPEPDAAEFSFSADEDASFACSLDGTSFVPCGVSRVYSDLAPGWHTFAVRATDRAGNTDPSPAEARWHAKNSHAGDTGGG